MEFKGKRIMVVCKETYSYPLYFLARKWLVNNKVAAFFFNPIETMYSKCLLNDTTYYAYKKLEGLKLYTSNRIAKEFTDKLYSNEYDYAYVDMIEKDYTHFMNLNMQILSTQFFTRHYHYRNYMHTCTYAQQLLWLELNYKNIISIIDDFEPDFILDTDSVELARTILREVCYKKNIPYVSVEYPRYEFNVGYTYSLGYSLMPTLVKSYRYYESLGDDSLRDEIDYVVDFRNKSSIMHDQYKGDVTSQYKANGLLVTFKRLLGNIKYFYIDQDVKAGCRKLKKSNPLLYNSSFEFIKFFIRYEYTKQKLYRKNKYFQNPIDGEKYVYMPLHLIPESSTFTLAPIYINELSIIEAVSKSLPTGWWLYVKEHQAMLGERGEFFYKAVNKLPNVKMVQLNYYQDPKPWIIKSQGVVTISGTSAYEAAMLGKHAIVFSDVPFSLIEGVHRCKSFEDLPAIISLFNNELDNIKSCASYIAAVKRYSYPMNLKLMLNQGLHILRGKADLDKQYQASLDSLEKLYLLAIENY